MLPLIILDTGQLEIIRTALKMEKFDDLRELYRPKGKVFNGSVKVMEMNKANQIKRVGSYNNSCKELETILQIVWGQVYKQRLDR